MSVAMPRRIAASTGARDQRSAPRFLTFRTGKIISLRDDKEILAAVLDLSAGGACLLVADIREVPDRFQFFCDRGTDTYCCEVRWKSGHKVGIQFI
jgi:hypothetical protein